MRKPSAWNIRSYPGMPWKKKKKKRKKKRKRKGCLTELIESRIVIDREESIVYMTDERYTYIYIYIYITLYIFNMLNLRYDELFFDEQNLLLFNVFYYFFCLIKSPMPNRFQ